VVMAGVLWGTGMLGLWVVSMARRGPAETWAAIRPEHADLWSMLNLALPILAAIVWTSGALAWMQRRARKRREA
jgi:hypothetical protein